ncbi:uncharacterized protein ISCGN_019109 [Ixodes scapularis]
MSLCGLGGCATTQTTNPFNFFVQMFSFILLRALLPVLASSDGTTACTIWNNEDQASSYHPAISNASSRPADSSLKQLILGQVWRAPSSSTAAYPPTINQPTQPMSLCGLGGCATTQTTNPFNFFVQTVTLAAAKTPVQPDCPLATDDVPGADDAVANDHQYSIMTSVDQALRERIRQVEELSSENESLRKDNDSQDQLLLVLSRLRVGLLEQDLAHRFGVHVSTVSRVWTFWVGFLADHFAQVSYWPSRQVVNEYMPECFSKVYPSTRVILDCTEVFIETPSDFRVQSDTYSNYKCHNTAKGLLGITPNGFVSFVSDLAPGRVSDKALTANSGLCALLEPGDSVMADRGFLISEEVEAVGATLNIPPFLGGKPQLSLEDEARTRAIAKVRIHVERVIGQMKSFRILRGTFPNSMSRSLDSVWKIYHQYSIMTSVDQALRERIRQVEELSSENESLRKDNDCQRKKNEALLKEVARLKNMYDEAEQVIDATVPPQVFTLTDVQQDSEKLAFYTGFESLKKFRAFVKLVQRGYDSYKQRQAPQGRPLNLSMEEQLLLVLSRLRVGLLEQDHAYRFGVHVSTVSRVWTFWVGFLADHIAQVSYWPSRQVVNEYMPECFSKVYPSTRVVLDCTEVFIETPSDFRMQSDTYSNYKYHNTAKGLLGIIPNGFVSFVSDLAPGRVSDKALTANSGLCALLEPGDSVMADRGL